jgi:hypothetical protein
MMKKIIILIIVMILCLNIVNAEFSFQIFNKWVTYLRNPQTFQHDLVRTGNFSGENITADNFFGDGSLLTGVSGDVNGTDAHFGEINVSKLNTTKGITSAGNIHFEADYVNLSIVDANIGALKIVEGDNEYMTFDTTDGAEDIEIHKDFKMSGIGLQDYLQTVITTSLTWQGLSTATASSYSYFSKDGDATDSVNINIFGVGTPDAVNNREQLRLGWFDDAATKYAIYTEAQGTGTLRPLEIYTEGNAGQLFLATNGNVGIGAANPAHKLTVEGDVNVSKNITANWFLGYVNSSKIRNTPLACPSGSYQTDYNGTHRTCTVDDDVRNGTDANFAYVNMTRLNITANAINTLNVGNDSHSHLYVDSNTGNVGVGTTNPLRAVHIVRTGTNADFKLERTDGANGTITSTSSQVTIGSTSAHRANFAYNNAWVFRYDGTRIWTRDGWDFVVDDTFVVNETTGRVGIGTTSPDYKFEIVSRGATSSDAVLFNLTNDINDGTLLITPGTGGDRHIFFGTGDTDSRLTFMASNNSDVAPRIAFVSGGDGASTSGTALFDYGSQYFDQQSNTGVFVRFRNSSLGTTNPQLTIKPDKFCIATPLSNNLDCAGGYERFYIDLDSGNVGIGTTTPSMELTIEGTTARALWNNTGGSDFVLQSGTLRSFIGSQSDHAVRFIVNDVPRLVINENEEMCFGDNLATAGNSCDDSDVDFYVNDTGVGIGTNNPTSTLDAVGVYSDSVGGTNCDLFMDNTGVFGCDPSELALKTNIKNITKEKSNKIYNLSVYTYDFIEDRLGSNKTGLIADELAETLPEAVHFKNVAVGLDDNNNTIYEINKSAPQGINYVRLVPLLIAEIQNLKKENEKLEQRVEVLEKQ